MFNMEYSPPNIKRHNVLKDIMIREEPCKPEAATLILNYARSFSSNEAVKLENFDQQF